MAVHVETRALGAQVVLHDSWLRVAFSDAPGDYADYHYVWLRNNCDQDRHPTTRERTVCPSELPLQLRPVHAGLRGEPAALEVEWGAEAGGRVSRYPLEWLREHAYALGREAVPPPPSDAASLTLDATGKDLVELTTAALALVRERGLCVVRNYGPETEVLIDAFADRGLAIRATHFGRIEDLRTDNTTNKNTDQLGYTDYPVKLHTDQPFLDVPPKFQLLQSMRKAEQGGENYVVDALKAAEYLRSIDQQAFELLTEVKVDFHRKQQAFERLVTAPILSFDHPEGFICRYSYFTMAPQKLDFALMENWYRAYTVFANLVNDPRHQYHVDLTEGDFLVYNNRRMLHARNGFKGARWVRGIYFDELD